MLKEKRSRSGWIDCKLQLQLHEKIKISETTLQCLFKLYASFDVRNSLHERLRETLIDDECEKK